MRPVLFFAFAAALLAQETPHLPAQPEDNAPRGSLSGSVVNSLTGEGVRRAGVTLFSYDGGSQANAQTGPGGEFRFTDLKAGHYQVIARHEDFFDSPGSPGVEVALAAGEEKQDVKIPLSPDGTVSGRVADQDGDPIDGANVQLLRYQWQRGKRELQSVNSAGSDDRGEYRLIHVLPGKYYLRVQSRAELPRRRPLLPPDMRTPGNPEVHADIFYPASRDLAGAARLQVLPGGNLTGIDFRLPTTAVTPVRGTVTGLGNSQGFQILLFPRDQPEPVRSFDPPMMLRFSGGRYEIEVPKPGLYRLVAVSYGRMGQRDWAIRDLAIGTTPIEGVDFQLTGGAGLNGSVKFDSQDGAAAQPSLDHAQVQIVSDDPELASIGPGETVEVRADGTFQLSSVPPGTFTVSVQGPFSAYVKSMRLGDREFEGGKLEIPASAAGPLKIVLGTVMGKLSGDVDLGDADAAALFVTAASDSGGFQTTAAPDSHGHFEFFRIAPGSYHVFAVKQSDNQLLLQGAEIPALQSLGQNVTIEAGSAATIELKPVPSEEIRKVLEDSE